MIEIERKFLVKSNDFKSEAFKKSRITQGFLNTDPKRTVRIRIRDNKAELTIKGLSSSDGLKRFEWEKEISKKDAISLLDYCEYSLIEKLRYEVSLGKHIFEIDEFLGDNEGLIIAELELDHESNHYEKPDWLGKEITGMTEYYNSQLSKRPFKTW